MLHDANKKIYFIRYLLIYLVTYLEIIYCNKKRIYKCKEITRLENALAFSPRNYAKSPVATKVLMYNSRGELHISFNLIPKPWPKSQILFHTSRLMYNGFGGN